MHAYIHACIHTYIHMYVFNEPGMTKESQLRDFLLTRRLQVNIR